jgi:hypothetical protein
MQLCPLLINVYETDTGHGPWRDFGVIAKGRWKFFWKVKWSGPDPILPKDLGFRMYTLYSTTWCIYLMQISNELENPSQLQYELIMRVVNHALTRTIRMYIFNNIFELWLYKWEVSCGKWTLCTIIANRHHLTTPQSAQQHRSEDAYINYSLN